MISIPEMYDNLVILNLHYFKRDSYISVICQASICAEEGRKADAVAHLASARSQNTGTGILGIPKRKGSCTAVASFSRCARQRTVTDSDRIDVHSRGEV